MYVFLTRLSSSLSSNHWITSLISLVSVLQCTCVATAGEKWGENVPKGEGFKIETENWVTRRKDEEKNPYEVFILWIFPPYIFSILLEVLRQSKYSSFSSCIYDSLKKRNHFLLSQSSLHLKWCQKKGSIGGEIVFLLLKL